MPTTSQLYLSPRTPFREVAFHAACMAYWCYGANPAADPNVMGIMPFTSVSVITPTVPLVPRVVVCRDSAGVQIAVAGTDQLQQWLNYLTQFGVSPATGLPGQIFTVFESWSQILVTQIRALVTQDDALFLCGSSLGGALSSIVAGKLKQLGYSVRAVYTVGCPRIGSVEYAEHFFQSYWHVRDELDPVPELPPPLFSSSAVRLLNLTPLPFMVRPGTDLLIPESDPAFFNANSLVSAFSPAAWAFNLTSGLAAHHPAVNYIAKIWARLSPRQAQGESLWFSICTKQFGIPLAPAAAP